MFILLQYVNHIGVIERRNYFTNYITKDMKLITDKLKIILIAINIFIFLSAFSQSKGDNIFTAGKMPQYFEPLPLNTKFEYIKTIEGFDKKNETEIYKFEIEGMVYAYLKTNGYPDCLIVLTNSFEGGELYKKIENNSFQHIVECRKLKDSYSGYLVDEDNESTKLVTMNESEGNMIDVLITCYAYYFISGRQ